jgi:hypothetical protein
MRERKVQLPHMLLRKRSATFIAPLSLFCWMECGFVVEAVAVIMSHVVEAI